MGEKRWIVLTTDGRHTTFGRHSDPSQEEVARLEAQLRGGGLRGWLAVTDGRYYGAGPLHIMMVRPLADPEGDAWERAVDLYQKIRSSGVDPILGAVRHADTR